MQPNQPESVRNICYEQCRRFVRSHCKSLKAACKASGTLGNTDLCVLDANLDTVDRLQSSMILVVRVVAPVSTLNFSLTTHPNLDSIGFAPRKVPFLKVPTYC